MTGALDTQKIGAIFQSRPDIIQGIQRAANSAGKISLFNEIASHVFSQLHDGSEPAQKRRRVDQAPSLGTNGASVTPTSGNAADEALLLVVKEISVSVPQRKKLELCFTSNILYARAPGSTAPAAGTTYAWKDIDYAFYLPVPDKAQVQHNYVLFPRDSNLPSKLSQPASEPLVFTVPSSAPKDGTVVGGEGDLAVAVSDSYRSLFHWALGRRFQAASHPVDIVAANPNQFHSMIRQAHRPTEKALHVSGFRGSKDGFLFFLKNGIFWGFKKPLMFIPLDRIAATSYTNILQITFNVVIEVFTGQGEETEEIEFGMLDQQDYGGIDDYIRQNRLQDRSMAEQRKGKLQLAENRGPKKKGEDGQSSNAGASGNNGTSELERAQLEAAQQKEDDDEEDEEDYQPGSEGESEASGESSEEDENEEEVEGSGGNDDDGDDDGDEAVETNEEEQQGVEERKARVKKEAASQPPVSRTPVRRGWATVSKARQGDDMDMEEKYDVVG